MRLVKYTAIFAASAFAAAAVLVAAMSFADTAPIGTVSITGSGSGAVPIATTTVAGKVKVGAGLGVTTDGTLSVTAAIFPNRTTLAAIGAGPTYKGQPIAPLATALRAGLVKVGTGLSVLPDGTLNNTGVAGVASFNARGGAVIPQANDYSIGQISGAAAVASTGAYSDLSGKPVLAPVATSGSYTDLTGRPSLAAVATSGSYVDLSNKPTIPAAQVNSDWGASSGVAQILNKPTIPTALSQLTQSASFRTVTDTEKATWNGNTAPVTSVFGRTGAVVKQAGDYTAADVGADALGAATSVQTSLNAALANYTTIDRPTRSEVATAAQGAKADTALQPGTGVDAAWGGWSGDSLLPLSWQLYSGSVASPLTTGTPPFRTASVVAADLMSTADHSAAVHQFKTTIRNGATGNWTGLSSLLMDYKPGTGDHSGIQSRVNAGANRTVGGGSSGGDMWGFYGFVANNGYAANGIGLELNVHNTDATNKSYLDDLPDGAGPNSTGHMMTGLQVNGDGSTYNGTRGISVGAASGSVGFDTGVSLTGFANVGIYINSPTGLAYRDPGINATPASKTDIKWGTSTSNIGLDLSAHTFTGSAIKLASGHTFTDGTVTKTLAQLATPPTNITGNAGTASALSAVSALPNGTTATTQTAGDNSAKVATTAYVNAAVSAAGGGNVTGPGSSTTGHIAVFAGTDGKTLADGGAAGTGTITGVTAGTGLTGGGTSGGVTVGLSDMGAYSYKGNATSTTAAATDVSRNDLLYSLGYNSGSSWGVELAAADTGNRSVYLDLHTADSSDFNARISKSSGLNSQFTFNNKGVTGTETGSIVFDSVNSVNTGNGSFDGNLGVGLRTPAAHLHVQAQDSNPTVLLDSYSNTTQPSIIGRRAGGTSSSPAQVGADFTLFNFAARPWFSDTAAWSTAGYASFTMKSAEAMDSTHHGTYMQFLTTLKGVGGGTGNSSAVRMQINDDGSIQAFGNLTAKTFTGTIPAATTYGATTTIDLSLGDSPSVTLTGNPTLAFSNVPAAPQSGWYLLELIQDATGGRTVTWPSSGLQCTWRNADGTTTAPTQVTTANSHAFYLIHTKSTTAADCFAR